MKGDKMGIWGGPAIFSNDLACDVRDEYVAKLYEGKSKEIASQEIITTYIDCVIGTYEEPLFWFALASIQWDKGRLMKDVKDNALRHIEELPECEVWIKSDDKKLLSQRRRVLTKLKEKLISKMGDEKKIRKPAWIWVSPWEKGSLLCYKMIDSRLTDNYLNKYVLARVLEVSRVKSSGFYTETVELGFYNWVGENVPDISITRKLNFLELSDQEVQIIGRMISRSMHTSISRKEIKDRELMLLEVDKDNFKSVSDFFEGNTSESQMHLYQ